MSEKIKWIFSKLYIQKKNSFLDRESKIFFFSPIIFIFGFFRIIQFYFIQKSMIHDVPNHIVIKTAASHMHKNYFRLFNKNADPSKFIFIECFNKHQFTKIKKLNFWNIFLEFHSTYRELIPILSKLKREEGKYSIAYEALVALPIFAYFTCLLKELKKENTKVKIFSGGADLISSSAIIANIETNWLCHGLIAPATLMNGKQIHPDPSKYSIVLPSFSSIYLYSNDEAKYLKDHGVSSNLCLYQYKKLDSTTKKIIIFLNDEDRNMNYKDLAELIEFFKEYNFKILVKFHPSYKGGFKKEFLDDHSINIINDYDASAFRLMLEEKPRFVAGWLSTTLCEAHRQGIVPICLAKEEDSRYTPYKFNQKSIDWKENKKLLDDCLKNNKDPFKMFEQI